MNYLCHKMILTKLKETYLKNRLATTTQSWQGLIISSCELFFRSPIHDLVPLSDDEMCLKILKNPVIYIITISAI